MIPGLDTPKRVLLIEPPFFRLFGYKRFHFPIALTLVGTYLHEQGHEVRILDADKPDVSCREYNRTEAGDNYPRYGQALDDPNHPAWGELRDAIQSLNPEVLCVAQTITAAAESADKVAAIGRQVLGPSVPIVTGGSHVRAMLDMNPSFDFGPAYDHVVREIPDLIDRRPNTRLLIGRDTYPAGSFRSIMSSTGCPNSCTFCCYSGDRRIQYRSLSNLDEELAELAREGDTPGTVYFIDDNFFANKKRFFAVADLAKQYGILYRASARIRDLSQDRLDKFLATGGTRLYVGIESGSQAVLDRIRKNVTIETILAKSALLNDLGIPWSAFFIAGFPFETSADLQATKDMVRQAAPTFASLNRFTPYPGTAMYLEFYKDRPMRFRDLFQLNRSNYIGFDAALEAKIEDLFQFVDRYNVRANQP